MFRSRLFGLLALSAVGFIWLSGCDKMSAKKEPPAGAGGTAAEKAEAVKIAAALAELPADDRKLAEEQKICPVSGEKLGTMAAPIKVTVNGQTVFLCCSGCEEDIKKDPDKYLAKLKK